jgi:subtilisin family serine protease
MTKKRPVDRAAQSRARRLARGVVALAVVGAVLPTLVPAAASADEPVGDPTPSHSRVVVKYKASADGLARRHSLSAGGLRVVKSLPITGLKVVGVPAGRTAEVVAAELRSDPAVAYAKPDVFRRPLANAPTPDDPYFDYQWGLRNSGQALPTDARSEATPVAGVDVDALGAWGVARGSSSVTVAVVDEGIELTHPDLRGALWTNPGESGAKATNGVDDDGNGYVDDVHGWDFVRGSGAVDTPADDDDHGTHVAGIIGATSNSAGVAGRASGVRLMSLKFMGEDGGYDSDAIEAIAYASEMGAKVVNASWGASLTDDPGAADDDLRAAIAGCGCVVVAAAGNGDESGRGLDTADPRNRVYPAAFGLANELSVGALNAGGRLASFSNYGVGVDLAAPGDAILSTLSGARYGWGEGTSMAAPFVSATAALMLSAAPSLTPEDVVRRIKASVQPLSALTGRVATGGMLDAGAALRALSDVTQPLRLSGADRYATAAKVADSFAPGVAVAYVASGEQFPDALAGAALAGSQGAPVLLTGPRALPTVTAAALSRLQPQRIVVLGGSGAVSSAVAKQLAGYAPKVSRLSGDDRYSTAASIAQTMMSGLSTDTVYVASGTSFPDALAGAALAGSTGQPVLLTSPGSLSTPTATWLSTHRPGRIVVLGGAAAVSDAVRDRLGDYTDGSVTRLAGADRYATAAAVAARFTAGGEHAYVASGLGFPDALAGAALAGTQGAPVLLTAPTSVPPSIRTALGRLHPQSVTVLGGTSVISSATAAALKLAARG